jgi:hypothetical protein
VVFRVHSFLNSLAFTFLGAYTQRPCFSNLTPP